MIDVTPALTVPNVKNLDHSRDQGPSAILLKESSSIKFINEPFQ